MNKGFQTLRTVLGCITFLKMDLCFEHYSLRTLVFKYIHWNVSVFNSFGMLTQNAEHGVIKMIFFSAETPKFERLSGKKHHLDYTMFSILSEHAAAIQNVGVLSLRLWKRSHFECGKLKTLAFWVWYIENACILSLEHWKRYAFWMWFTQNARALTSLYLNVCLYKYWINADIFGWHSRSMPETILVSSHLNLWPLGLIQNLPKINVSNVEYLLRFFRSLCSLWEHPMVDSSCG